jgi:hypothetical protein
MLTSMEAPELQTPDPARALNMGVGMASPLWPAFLATAGAGVAYWWMARWIQGERRVFAPASEPDAAYPLGPPAELTEAVTQAYAEPVEAVVEAAEDVQAGAIQAAEDAVEQTAAAAESALDQVGETAEAAADGVAERTLAALDPTAEAVPTASKPPRSRRERPAE